jgi:hypothetical protein
VQQGVLADDAARHLAAHMAEPAGSVVGSLMNLGSLTHNFKIKVNGGYSVDSIIR